MADYQKAEWQRNSDIIHEYNKQYNKTLTPEQKAQKFLKQRERYAYGLRGTARLQEMLKLFIEKE